MEECLAFAKSAGYVKMMLWTNDILVSARRIYQAAGFEVVSEEHHHSFGHDMVARCGCATLMLDRRKAVTPAGRRFSAV